MGKGDQRTKRGKIWRGTYGKTRPQSKRGEKTPRVQAAPRPKPLVQEPPAPEPPVSEPSAPESEPVAEVEAESSDEATT